MPLFTSCLKESWVIVMFYSLLSEELANLQVNKMNCQCSRIVFLQFSLFKIMLAKYKNKLQT
jgi:hypothetical protein